MIVYHYCSLESLNSILKNRSLRLTNILKSNDSKGFHAISAKGANRRP